MAASSKLGFEPHMTYDEISRELGVSRERLRQIERKALEKLRLSWAAREDDCTTDDAGRLGVPRRIY